MLLNSITQTMNQFAQERLTFPLMTIRNSPLENTEINCMQIFTRERRNSERKFFSLITTITTKMLALMVEIGDNTNSESGRNHNTTLKLYDMTCFIVNIYHDLFKLLCKIKHIR